MTRDLWRRLVRVLAIDVALFVATMSIMLVIAHWLLPL